MVSNFSTSRRSRRWPLALFYALLDITALNSYIIFNYQIDKKDQKERSTFIVDLGRSLIDEHLATRGRGGQRGRLGSGDNRGCYNCGEEDHRKFECTKPARGGGSGRGQSRDGGSNNTCYNCGEVGHRKYECTNNTAEDGGQEENQRKSKKACYTCGEFGHKKDDCPKSGTQESGDEEESSDNEEEETPQKRKQAEDSEEKEDDAPGKRQEQRNEETPTSTSTWLSRRCKDDQEQETEEDCPTPTASSTRDGRMQRDNQDQDPEKSLPSMPAVHTRYGRAVKIPRRKFQFRLLLEQNQLLDIVDGKEIKPEVSDATSAIQDAWHAKDIKARMLISQALELRFLEPLMSCKTAAQMWTRLMSIHEQRSEIAIGMLWQQFFDARMSSSEDVSSYIAKIENLSARIQDAGGTITDDQKVAKIINSLPSSMRYFIPAWESQAPITQTLENLSARLLIEECRNQQADSSQGTAFYQQTKPRIKEDNIKKTDSGKISELKKKTECHYCHKIGHWSRECRKRIADQQKKNEKRKNQAGDCDHKGFNADTILKWNDCDIWWADSGASCSMTFRRDWFKSFTPIHNDHRIYLGDNTSVLAEGTGDIEILAMVNGEWITTSIRNVLYSSKLKKNFFSLGVCTEKGYRVDIDRDELRIYSRKDLKAVGQRQDGLYKMMFRVTSSSQGFSAKINNLQLWHERLAHISLTTIREMAKKGLINGLQPEDIKEDDFFCQGCQEGKAHRKPSHLSETKEYNPGEFILSDICGPMPTQSIGGSLYFILFKDYSSGFRHIDFIRHKSDILHKFENFARFSYNQTGNKIKVIRTDNALEYTSKDFTNTCRKFGIVHQLSAPYVHEQIGRVERDNRTIVEAARSMLCARNLPEELWAEACNTATFILNRTFTKQAPNTTPYELFFGRKVSLYNLKIFGCEAWLHTPKERRRKWDKKSQKMIFLGYDKTCTNFRLWNPSTRKISISKDVTFNETKLRHCELEGENLIPINLDIDLDPPAPTTEDEPPTALRFPTPSGFHPMITRSKKKADSCNYHFVDEPSTYKDAMESPNAEKWLDAMKEEIKALESNNTWSLETLPDGYKPIGSKWVYKLKSHPNSTAPKFKARLVAKGYTQRKNVDYFDTFSPVVRYDSLRVLLANAASERMFLKQFDVKTAFLYGDLDEVKYLDNPGQTHWTAIKNVFRYLKATPQLGILYASHKELTGYSDSDYARDLDSRKSTTGYIFMLNHGAFSWSSQKQSTVALSTTESEYIAACAATKEMVWLRRLLKDIGIKMDRPTVLNIDKQAAIKLVQNPEFQKRTKHIDVRYHYIRTKQEDGELITRYVSTLQQTADLLTKPLGPKHFRRLLENLNADETLIVFIRADDKAWIRSALSSQEPLLKSIAKSVNRLPANSSVTVQWLPAHVGIPGNELADSLAKAGALGLPEARESTTQLDERDLLRTIKTQCLQEWKSDAAHDWYRAGGTSTGSVLPREQQSLISRLKSGHLRTMTFQNGCKVFPLCTKCNSQPATPRHIIDCIDSSIDELYSSPADTIKNLKLYRLDTLV
ncbi:hypothetical protein LAZ67_22002254 [Cordylochernes scorpioides]|uniref:Polyprotein n=1 Tax=Cordylochernes scorpioides TaxID=51811 RepID=A0ABY6LPI1_9ARAC|nr:hypothetical protein LAZ67_22002254 [Cordylochernes scorpioides]